MKTPPDDAKEVVKPTGTFASSLAGNARCHDIGKMEVWSQGQAVVVRSVSDDKEQCLFLHQDAAIDLAVKMLFRVPALMLGENKELATLIKIVQRGQ